LEVKNSPIGPVEHSILLTHALVWNTAIGGNQHSSQQRTFKLFQIHARLSNRICDPLFMLQEAAFLERLAQATSRPGSESSPQADLQKNVTDKIQGLSDERSDGPTAGDVGAHYW